jgi:hypothetical protein
MTKDELLTLAAGWDQRQPGERWKTWLKCDSPHTRAELQATSDEPPYVFCERCQCVWKPPPGQLFPEPNHMPGELLNVPKPPK